MQVQSIRLSPIDGVRPEVGFRDYRESWPELRLKLPEAEPAMRSISGKTTVAVVDSGVPIGCVGPASSPAAFLDRDDDGHAAQLVATMLGSERMSAGSIDIVCIKAFSAQGWPKPDPCALAIDEARKHTAARVIVLAWDVGHATDQLIESIKALGDSAVVVIAAGNWALNNDKHENWPANCGTMPHVITVMAANEDDERASYSNYGKSSVFIAAPGLARVQVSSWPSVPRAYGSLRDSYSDFKGTSAATAHVARLAALVLAKHPGMSPADVKTHLDAKSRRVPALSELCVTGAVADYSQALA